MLFRWKIALALSMFFAKKTFKISFGSPWIALDRLGPPWIALVSGAIKNIEYVVEKNKEIVSDQYFLHKSSLPGSGEALTILELSGRSSSI